MIRVPAARLPAVCCAALLGLMAPLGVNAQEPDEATEVSTGPDPEAPNDLTPGADLPGETNGVIVRLRTRGPAVDGPVVVALAPSTGAPIEVRMHDDGESPDVTAGDGQWAGVATTAPFKLDVSVSAASSTWDGGAVEWPADSRQRDLALTIEADGTLRSMAKVADGAAGPVAAAPKSAEDGARPTAGGDPSGAPAAPGASPGGVPAAPGDASGGVPAAPGASPGGVPAAPGAALGPAPGNVAQSKGLFDGPSTWISLGALALGMFAVGVVVMGGRGNEGDLDDLPQRLSEVGLLAPGLPSASAGLSVWEVAGDAELGAALRPLLATLADGRSVVVVAPAGQSIPAVVGGPVFQAPDAASLAEAVDAVVDQIGGAVTVLLVGNVGESPNALAADLPPGVGGVMLTTQAPSSQQVVVALSRSAAGWAAQVGDRPPVSLIETRRGFSARTDS